MELLEIPREQDYFSERGIRELTGFGPHKWPLVVTKELIDNALDALDEVSGAKTVKVTASDAGLSVSDSGPGIEEDTLKLVYDFTKYTSSKFFHTLSRGQLGHGLKVVIGICFLKGWHLSFVTRDNTKVAYIPNEGLIRLGLRDRCFVEHREPTLLDRGVYIQGDLDIVSQFWIDSLIDAYRILNPYVRFIYNGRDMQALVNSQKMQRLHSIHWYTVDEFGNLAFVYQNKYPKRETRSFASIFVRKVKLDGGYPRILRLFFSQKDSGSDLRINLERLFLELRRKSPVIPPKPLEKFAIGRRAAQKIPEFVKYTSVPGIYRSLNMNLPYLVEILLLSHEGKNKVIYGINRSPAIDVWPFVLSTSFTFPITIGRKKEEITTETSVSDFLEKTGFLEGEGYKMFIHLVCPRLHFLDKSKNAIIFDNFMDAFVKAIEPHLATIRKSQRLRKLKSPNGFLVTLDAPKRLSKKTLMFEYFMEGYGMASGDGQYVTTARQVFYAVRKLIINNENITLTGSDFDTFTQKVLTGMFEKHPDLVTKIYFEQRGTFIDYDTQDEFPISTRSVTEYLERMKKRVNCTCRLQRGEYHESSLSFDYPPELGISSVLFVEKQGFREVLVSSGIQDELAISLILSQGYGTRDMKKLMDAFLERGVTVYVLHDCDIDGYQIKNKLLEGSETYNKPLDVVDIGLSLDDIRALGKLIDAEEYTSEKSYSNVLENMSDEEKEFFWPGKKRGTKNGERTYIYRRVELNALTMPELLDFLRQKVKRRQIIPTPDQLHDFKETLLRNFDADSLIWDSLWEVTAIFREKLSKQLLSDNSIRMAVSRAFVRFDDIVKAGKVKNWKEALKDCIKSELDQLRAEIRNTIEKILNIDSI